MVILCGVWALTQNKRDNCSAFNSASVLYIFLLGYNRGFCCNYFLTGLHLLGAAYLLSIYLVSSVVESLTPCHRQWYIYIR